MSERSRPSMFQETCSHRCVLGDIVGRCRRLVELNVIEQCLNVFQTGVVQRQRLKTFHERDNTGATFATPRIHAMVFDPSDGVLRKLKVNFKEVFPIR